jgi:hypothetical protein
MSDFNTSKVDGNTVGSAEWNQLSDVDNLTTTSGQTPSTTDLFQLSIASARYSSGGQFFTDSGTANAYVLSPVSPFKSPVDATNTYFNGMTIRFRAGNANSGASTINVNGAGLKNLKKEDGSTDLTAGDILTTKDSRFRYNGTSFVLVQDIRPATTTNQGVSYLNNPITVNNNATDANNDIDFSAGNFILNNGSGQGLLATALTKRLDASWVAGTNQGGLLSGTKAINSTYHWFAIQKPDGTVDVGAILGVAGTTPDPTSVLPSGYTTFSKNPIVSVITDGSGNIINGDFNYKQDGNYIFKFNADITEFSRTNTAVSSLQEIKIPAGIKVQAHCGLYIDISSTSAGTNSAVTVQDFNKNTVTHYASGVVKVASFTNTNYAKPLPVISNKSRQIWFSSTGATNLSSVGLYTLGWETIY